ncbi:hypothetical protein M231_03287 [Tremella mesenterica]|uniref:Uncharacterized protein n=1 Tax=Tremella mesenterica TaxID=5217 RepID=A0A4Q1BNL7_TREME|nr:hypothetical protein M231_03287 [Tremella mesenterica]
MNHGKNGEYQERHSRHCRTRGSGSTRGHSLNVSSTINTALTQASQSYTRAQTSIDPGAEEVAPIEVQGPTVPRELVEFWDMLSQPGVFGPPISPFMYDPPYTALPYSQFQGVHSDQSTYHLPSPAFGTSPGSTLHLRDQVSTQDILVGAEQNTAHRQSAFHTDKVGQRYPRKLLDTPSEVDSQYNQDALTSGFEDSNNMGGWALSNRQVDDEETEEEVEPEEESPWSRADWEPHQGQSWNPLQDTTHIQYEQDLLTIGPVYSNDMGGQALGDRQVDDSESEDQYTPGEPSVRWPISLLNTPVQPDPQPIQNFTPTYQGSSADSRRAVMALRLLGDWQTPPRQSTQSQSCGQVPPSPSHQSLGNQHEQGPGTFGQDYTADMSAGAFDDRQFDDEEERETAEASPWDRPYDPSVNPGGEAFGNRNSEGE